MKKFLAAFVSLFLFCVCAWAEPKTYGQKVLLPDGKPAVGAKVRALFGAGDPSASFMRAPEIERELVTKTDETGRFQVKTENDAERLQLLAVDVPGHAISFWNFQFALENPIKLQADAPLTGKVVDAKGEPVPDAMVVTTTFATNSYVPLVIQDLLRVRFPELTTRTRADGTFSSRLAILYGFPDEGQMLSTIVKRGEHTFMGGTRRFQKDHAIVIYPNVSIRGRVVDDATSKPVAGARVEYAGEIASTTDAQGRFRFDDLMGNTSHRLLLTHRDYPNAVLHASTPFEKIDDTTLQNEVVLRLRRVARVSGVVVDEKQHALPFRISVRAWAASGDSPGWSQGIGEQTTTFF